MGFPPHNAIVYRNEAGEPLGWDVPSDDPPDLDDSYSYDPDDDEDADDERSWTIDSAIWQIEHGEQGTDQTNSAYEFLRKKTARGTEEEMREIGTRLLEKMKNR